MDIEKALSSKHDQPTMEQLEIKPANIRIVCLNQPHLKPWWILKSLSSNLGCIYNPHQPQIVWTQCHIPLPTPKIVRIKGHTSHPLPSTEAPVINANVQMVTYLLFAVPKRKSPWHTCHLVINGVESALQGKNNPSKFTLQLVLNESEDDEVESNDNCEETSLTKDLQDCSINNIKNTANHVNNGDLRNNINQNDLQEEQTKKITTKFIPTQTHVYPTKSMGKLLLDFETLEEFTTIAEEEESVPSDQSDASDDIHKIVRKRLVADINPMIEQWQKSTSTDNNILILMLRPAQKFQAWQFLSAWITITQESNDTDSVSLKTLSKNKVRRKGLARTRPILSLSSANLLNGKKISYKQQLIRKKIK